ncbi:MULTISPECIES: peptidase dimerization domain-containing protein [Sphingobium]|uniref:peptidase dimerization domain-containing protein n=1 Tax=Sphingobium TaxID=165695 RepID=UPI00159C5562
MSLHVGEKAATNFRIEATNPGGHSSAPVRDNAIYELADALVRIRDLEFPMMLNDTTRAFFSRLARRYPPTGVWRLRFCGLPVLTGKFKTLG